MSKQDVHFKDVGSTLQVELQVSIMNLQIVRDHPFKTSACLRGEGVSQLPTFANSRGVGVYGMPTSAIFLKSLLFVI